MIHLNLKYYLGLILLIQLSLQTCKTGCAICFSDQVCYKCTDEQMTPESDCKCPQEQFWDLATSSCQQCHATCKTCENNQVCTQCKEQDGLAMFGDKTCQCVMGFKQTQSTDRFCEKLFLYGNLYYEQCPKGTKPLDDVKLCEQLKIEDVLPGDRLALLTCAILLCILLIILALMLYLYMQRQMVKQFEKQKKGQKKILTDEEANYLLMQQEREKQKMIEEQELSDKLKEVERQSAKKRLEEAEEKRKAEMEIEMGQMQVNEERERLLYQQQQMMKEKQYAEEAFNGQVQFDTERQKLLENDRKLREWEERFGNGRIQEEYGRLRKYEEDYQKETKLEEMRLRKWEKANGGILQGQQGQYKKYMKDRSKEKVALEKLFYDEWQQKNGALSAENLGDSRWRQFQEDKEIARLAEEAQLLAQWKIVSKGEQDDQKKLRKYEGDIEKARKLFQEEYLREWEGVNGRLADPLDRNLKIQDMRLRNWECGQGSILKGKFGQLKYYISDIENERQLGEQKFKEEWEKKNGRISGDSERVKRFQEDLERKIKKDEDLLIEQWNKQSKSFTTDKIRLKKYEEDMEKARQMMQNFEQKIADQKLRKWEEINGSIVKPPSGQYRKFMQDEEYGRKKEEQTFRREWEHTNGPIFANETSGRKFHSDFMDFKKTQEQVYLLEWEAKSKNSKEDEARIRKYEEDMERARNMEGDRDKKIRDMRLRRWEQANGCSILKGYFGKLREFLRDQENQRKEDEIRFKSQWEQNNGRIMGEESYQAYLKAYQQMLQEEEVGLLKEWNSLNSSKSEEKLRKYDEDWAEALRLSKLKKYEELIGRIGNRFEDSESRKRKYAEDVEQSRTAFEKDFVFHEHQKKRLNETEERRVKRYMEDMSQARSLEMDIHARLKAEEEAERKRLEEEERRRLAAEMAEKNKLRAERQQQRQLTRMKTQAMNDGKVQKMREERERLLREKTLLDSEKSKLQSDVSHLDDDQKKLEKENQETRNRKEECKLIKESIIKKQAEIAERRKELDQQMEGVDYEGTREKVRNMNQEDLIFLQNLRNPPARVVLCLEAVVSILYNNNKKVEWKEIKIVISNLNFRKDILNYDPDQLTNSVLKHVNKNYICSPEWQVPKLYKASKACGVLSEWIDALMKFKTMLSENKELFEQMKKMKKVENEMQQDVERLEELERLEKEFTDKMDFNFAKMGTNLNKRKDLQKTVTLKDEDLAKKMEQLNALKTDNLTLEELEEEDDEDDDEESQKNNEILKNL